MSNKDTYEIKGVKNWNLNRAINIFNMAKILKMDFPDYLNNKIIRSKQDDPTVTNNRTGGCRDIWSFAYGSNREFPLETVELQSYNLKHEKNVESAIIHTGYYANEFTRSMDTLAIATACGIFFRDNKFNTATEEGRKLLAHELTHMSQFENPGFEDIEELEREAEKEERIEINESDPTEVVEFNGITYYLRKSQQKKIVYMVADKVIKWIEEQKILTEEDEYLKLLIAFNDYITDPLEIYKTAKTALEGMHQELLLELRRRAMC